MRTRAGISTSDIFFIISKPVSAVRADATEVRYKTYSTNGLPATRRQSGSKLKKIRKKNFSTPLRPEKYAESIGEIRFQIRSQSREIFAILWPPCLLFPIRRNAASTTTRVGRYFALGYALCSFF